MPIYDKFFSVDSLHDTRELIRRADRRYSDRIAYRQFGSKKKIEEFSFRRLNDDLDALGTYLLSIGADKWHVAILGENSYEWVISYFSCINAAGCVVPMDKELLPHDLVRLMRFADVDCLICSVKLSKLLPAIMELFPELKHVVIMRPAENLPEGCQILTDWIAQGYELLANGDRSFLDMEIDADKMSEILFTSGTTGANKGVMLTQTNVMSALLGAMQYVKPGKMSFSVLPVNHSYECTCHIMGGIHCGACICFNDSLKHVSMNINLFQPECTVMVPLFLESIMRSIWREAEKSGLAGGMRRGVVCSNLLRKVGLDFRRVLFKPVLEKLGGNLSQIICGGAPLRAELAQAFDNIGVAVMNGYGITECAPLVAVNMSYYQRKGSAGKVIGCCKVRIAHPDDENVGEIEVKGSNVMLGYYKDEAATKVSFTEDGWFRTGDLGYLDKDNFLYLKGREKNLIILPNGKNVHPEELEELITQKLPYIKEIVVCTAVDDSKGESHICAICYVDPEWLQNNAVDDLEEYLWKEMVAQVNSTLPRYKQIAEVVVRSKEFEKTTTNKIKRREVEQTVHRA